MEFEVNENEVLRVVRTSTLTQEVVIKSFIGSTEKTETINVYDNILVDVTYQFDLELGQYVETSRGEEYPDPNAVDPKQAKITELNSQCNATILAGFTSSALGTPHEYDFDYEAQTNIGGVFSAIIGGLVTTPQYWKASGIPALHTTDQLKQLFADGFSHKNTNIGKYWTLKSEVLAAETQEQIDAVQW